MFDSHDELYGELYYYSVIKILNYLNITSVDHFLDIGSGLGKIVFQVFLTTQVASVTGIEINNNRSVIANKIKQKIATQLPEIFNNRNLNLIHGDFLHYDFNNITIIYLCCTVFSTELLSIIQKEAKGRIVVDCGAGEGLLGSLMKNIIRKTIIE